MSEPAQFPPAPFDPVPLAPGERSGCRKVLLFGCGGILVLLAVACLVLVKKAPAILAWGLELAEKDVQTKIAPDVPAADRERLHRAFASARRNLAGISDPAALQEFQSTMIDLSGKLRLSKEDVERLASALEGIGRAAPPAAPAPKPSRTPTAPAARAPTA
ncbi:MAG TPA: hypothetical protein VN783_03020 [Thermoanaerobaculia bacterium]|nr:hypothetical protein [Thermoanaerobaculia bacterium]